MFNYKHGVLKMTKKSLARQQRDAKEKDAIKEANIQIKGNQIYDEIRNCYQTSGQAIASYAESFNELCIKEIIPNLDVEQQQKVEVLVKSFKEDIVTLTDDLIKINEPFKDKKGGEPSLDKFIDTIGVVDQFSELIGRTKNVLDPTFRALAAEVSVTLENITPPEQDVNVITDVTPKEV